MLTKSDRVVIGGIVREAIGEFAVVVNKSFDTMQKNMDIGLDLVNQRLDKVELKIDGIQSQIVGINNRFDSHLLDCVRHEQHNRLEKRVEKLES